ncbi:MULTISPECIES: hypothetical protein [unclassified Duganella]|uniref:hypothetical protein n=1 Tax=unclassified Duganella TaxID=2636909 RepID=UPI000B825756|nr:MULTISPECIES: hypothetical protein [unclassified Duganella]
MSCCLAALAPAAQAQADCLPTVWHGEVGGAAITLEFGNWLGASAQLAGRYHLGRSQEDNYIVPDPGDSNRWQAVSAANKTLGHVTFWCGTEGYLRGMWESNDGKVAQLDAEPSGKGYYYAGDREYAIQVDGSGAQGRQRYERISIKGMPNRRSVRLGGQTEIINDINRRLRDDLVSSVMGAQDCASQAWFRQEAQPQATGRYEDELLFLGKSIAALSRHWQAACDDDFRANVQKPATMFNLNTGEQELVTTWLADPEIVIASQDEVKTEPATYRGTLSQLLWQAYRHKDPSCAANVTFTLLDDHIAPTPQGMAFTPLAATEFHRCIAPAVVPYQKMRPFLSELGTQRINELLSK